MELDILFERAVAANREGEFAEAEKLCREILDADPDHLGALYALATLAYGRGQFADAEGYAARIAALNPSIAEAPNLRGMAQAALGRLADAAISFAAAAKLMADPTDAFYNCGNILFALGRFEEALALYDAAVARRPQDALIVNNRGNTLRMLRRLDDALAAYDRASVLDSSFTGAYLNRGIVLQALGKPDDALASFDQAISREPNNAEAYYNRGVALARLKRFEEARACYTTTLRLAPTHTDAAAAAFGLDAILCDWRDWEQRAADLIPQRIRAGEAIAPLSVIGFSDDPALQAQAARQVATPFNATFTSTAPIPVRSIHPRIRLAYLSADFRNHVVGHTLIDLFERIDRSRFEVWGMSLTAAPHGAIRDRLIAAFDHHVDASTLSDQGAAVLLREQEIDVAVDLMGHTENARLGIFARRAAPLQVNQFGYPGTDGADFIDYIIGDRIALPQGLAPHFNERIVTLPDCYLPSASMQIPAGRADRRLCKLPDEGFVFCNFNASQKITPPIFDIWMRLLASTETSVLWLYASGEAQVNLRREATLRAIDPNRLIFAPPLERSLHLARLDAADLFLDTTPYNAHTTAVEALWAGVPVLTCIGKSMAARVGASVLQAAGLPELAVSSLADYEATALALAKRPEWLSALRAKLEAARKQCALFDLKRYCHHIEAAYLEMYKRYRDGLAPASFAIEPNRLS